MYHVPLNESKWSKGSTDVLSLNFLFLPAIHLICFQWLLILHCLVLTCIINKFYRYQMFEIQYQYCISTLQYLSTFITIYTSFLESIHIFFTAPSTANFGQKDHEEILQVRLHIKLQNHLIGGHVLQPLGWAPDGAPGNGASTKGRAICQLKGLDVLDGGSGLSKSESRQLQLG